MPVIDADTHVDETEDTWEHLRPEEQRFKPEYYVSKNFDPARGPGHYWVFQGKRQRRRVRSDEKTQTTKATRELIDVEARVRHMDQLGVDTHIIYPTVFCTEFITDTAMDVALKRTYNRWVGERTGASEETRRRLRWVVVPPTMDMDATLEEMRWGRDHGACGVMKKGDIEAGHWPAEEYFFPLYEEAQKLDLTICFHLGGGVPDQTPARLFSHVSYMQTRAPIVNGFLSLIAHNIPSQFPKLRFAFVENGSSWLPNVIYTLQRQKERRPLSEGGISGPDFELGQDIMKDNRMFVTCQVDEDLPYILKYAGEDSLLVGSDYSHSDPSQEGNFAELLRGWVERGQLSQRVVDKIMYDNPKACYGL
jgi:predicted TIM-barrel fold metal-dependent hydrolase